MWGTVYPGHRKLKIGRAGIAAIIICAAVIAIIVAAALLFPEEPAEPAAPDDGDTGMTIAEYNNTYGQEDSSVTVSRDGAVSSK